MTDAQSSGGSREQRFQDALAAILQRLEAEPAADLKALLAGAPDDLRAELQDFFRNRSFLDRVDPQWTPAGQPAERVRYFGDYELLEEVARGGMGVVYKARQQSLGRIVALKMILVGRLASPADVQRFRAEAENAASLDHPNIVPIYEVGEHEGQHFFSMKFIEGGSLAARRSGDPKAAARLVATVARAVHYAHQGGILHRDLKPQNILLDADGQPHVTDFGLAKRIAGSSQTLSGAIVGTPGYASPEQASGQSKRLTTAADVYGLGAVLYECLAGSAPFRAETPLETLMQVLHQEPTPPSRLGLPVPRDLETICLKCLRKDPAQRYATAEALAEDLERFVNGEPIAARPVGMIERGWRWCRRNRAVAALLGMVAATLLLGSLVSGYFAWRASDNAEEAQTRANEARTAAQEKEKQWQRAEREKEEKERQRQQAVKERQDARLRLFNSQFYRVEMVYRSDRETAWGLLHHLAACPPDLRDFTWGLYNRWCQSVRAVFRGHTATVTCVAYSPDGKTLVSGSEDRTIRVWDVRSGQERSTLRGHTDGVTSVAFSPDGKTLASASKDRTVKLWDAQTGKERATLKGHTGPVLSVAFSPDGGTLASADQTIVDRLGEIKLWDAVRGQERASLPGHTGGVLCVAFSPDGQTLASASYQDGTIRLWDVKTNQERATLKGHARYVSFSPDGKTIASCNWQEIKLWDAASRKERATLKWHTAPPVSLAFSPDGNTLVAASREIQLWDAKTGQERATLQKPTKAITCVTFSPDGTTLATGSDDGAIEFWEANTGEADVILQGDGPVVFSPDGKTLAGTRKDAIILWDARTGQERATLKGPHEVKCLAFSPDGKTLAAGGYWESERVFRGDFHPPLKRKVMVGSITWWDVPSGQEHVSRRVDEYPVRSLVFSPDGKTLASGSDGKKPDESTGTSLREGPGEVILWDAMTGKRRATLKGHETSILSVVFSPDSNTVASISVTRDEFHSSGGNRIPEGVIKLWDAATGKERATIRGRALDLSPASFSPDSKILASNDADERIKLWDTATGRERASLNGHGGHVIFSPDGKTLVSHGDGRVTVWDAATGQERSSSKGDAGGWLVYTPDGKTMASVSGGAIKLWDGVTGQERASLKGHPGVGDVAFSPDGQTLASVGGGTIKLWKAHRGQERATIKVHWPTSRAVAFSPDGKTLALANSDKAGLWHPPIGKNNSFSYGEGRNPNTITFRDPVTGQERLTFKEDAVCFCFSPDGKTIAVVNWDNAVNLWDIATGRHRDIRQDWHHARWSSPNSVSFSPDGKTVAVGQDDAIQLWDVTTGRLRASLDGQRIKLTKEALTWMWKDKAPKALAAILNPLVGKEFPSRYAFVKVLQRLEEEKRAARRITKEDLGELDNVLRRLGFDVIQPYVFSVCFSPDGTLLASAHADTTAFKLSDEHLARLRKDGVPEVVVAKLTPLVGQEFISQAAFVKALGQRLDREELAPFQGFLLDLAERIWSSDRKGQRFPAEVKLWDVATGQVRAILKGHRDFVSAVVFSPDGKTLASCGRDGQVKLWDVATRKERAVLKTLAESVAFSPDSRTLASGGGDTAVRLWDAATGQQRASLQGHFRAVLSVAFSPDGKTVASGSMDGTIKLWDVPPAR
jgi:WD40 repeat protein